MRPPMAYYGGKTRPAKSIAALIPPHRCYIEPYAGALAVLLAKAPSVHEVVNDIDGDVVNFWRVLREQPDELALACWATPYAREEYLAARVGDVGDDLERARRWWVRITQSHGRTNTTAGWSTGLGRSASRPHETVRAAGRMPEVAHRLRRVAIEHRDALECIQAYDAIDVVHYVDPPYPAEARSSVGYQHEMFHPEQHEALADTLGDCRGTVLLSGYRCPLYDRLFGDWPRVEFGVRRSNGGRRAGRSNATEVVWSNRPLDVPSQLRMFEETA